MRPDQSDDSDAAKKARSEDFCDLLLRAQKNHNLDNPKIADMLGCHPKTIYQIWTGRATPSESLLRHLRLRLEQLGEHFEDYGLHVPKVLEAMNDLPPDVRPLAANAAVNVIKAFSATIQQGASTKKPF
jgi:hypothetical protein